MGADVNHHRVLDGATALMVAAMQRNVREKTTHIF
jgi:hypothetical protein